MNQEIEIHVLQKIISEANQSLIQKENGTQIIGTTINPKETTIQKVKIVIKQMSGRTAKERKRNLSLQNQRNRN